MESKTESFMKIVDFCKDFDKTLWGETLEIIVKSNDDLKKNYISLKPSDFVCWPVLIENDKIVCFSGLQINSERWSNKFARINSRFFISPTYRHRNPGKLKNQDKFLNTKYLLPIQIKKAKELKLSGVFMSREGDHKRVFEKYSDLAFRNTGHYFKILDHRYNVCGCLNSIPNSCKQWIALHLFECDEKIWHESMNKFKIID